MKRFTLLFVLVCGIVLSAQSQSESIYDTYYYEYSQIYFGKKLNSEGLLEEVAETFSLNGKPVEIKVLLEQDKSLMLSELIVEVYEEAGGLVESFTVKVGDRNWNWVSFSQTFSKPGKYYIDMYNEADTFINSAGITIEE